MRFERYSFSHCKLTNNADSDDANIHTCYITH